MFMSRTHNEYNSTWVESDGSVVEIPDSYDCYAEHFNSILKAAEMADVNSELTCFGHKDVTLLINSETSEDIRTLKFTFVVKNWRDHTKGESAYSDSGLVEYKDISLDEEPDELMYSTGAFFHKISNRFSDIFEHTDYTRPMLRLDYCDNNEVRYKGEISLHRYDN